MPPVLAWSNRDGVAGNQLKQLPLANYFFNDRVFTISAGLVRRGAKSPSPNSDRST